MAVRIESRAEPIPGYKLLERLGGGGFGEVWKVEAPGGLHKAIKFVYGDLQTTGDEGLRAEQELKALSRVKSVRHPYILSLERFDIIDGQLLIVMELADRNLWDRYRECRALGLPGIPREELLRYMEESAEALDLMNTEYQLQHLDIKPQNIFLVHNHIKVADFGLVKDLEGMVASVTGGVTPVYAAPETFDGWVSRFSDQYSLSIVYQELLTGQRPFTGANVRQLVMQHLQGTPDLSALPAYDRPVIARALSKDPNSRYSSCREMVEALREAEARHKAAQTLKSPEPAETPTCGHTPLPKQAFIRRRNTEATVSGQVTLLSVETARLGEEDSQGSTPAACSGSSPETPTMPRPTPTEVTGDGVLCPALVISLGGVGLEVLRYFRRRIEERFGTTEALPNVRLLHIDTDPAVVREALQTSHGTTLSANEVLLARLNRPSHYLKPRDGRSCMGSWFNPKLLYRIPRTQITTGVRAIGRLAFCDNYPAIVRRLEAELEACTNPEQLEATVKDTQLGLRTNLPAVYVVAGLGGGTGSGMFIDTAYVARSVLKKLGYAKPQVHGLFLVPVAGPKPHSPTALGNAVAALMEWNHFASPRMTFSATYMDREPPITDTAPPFDRSVLLPLTAKTSDATTPEFAPLAAEYLYRELCSELGRVTEERRADLKKPAGDTWGLSCLTFGMYRFSWPKRRQIEQAASRLCQRLVERWMSKDSRPIEAQVRGWVQERFQECQLGTEVFLKRLQEGYTQRLGQAPESEFAAIVARTVGASSGGATPAEGGSGYEAELRPAAGDAPDRLSAENISAALRGYAKILGDPHEPNTLEEQPPVIEALRETCSELVADWGQKLAELIVHLIEQPEYRLAGAEEAVRQIVAQLEQVLRHHEALARELSHRASEALKSIPVMLGNYQKSVAAARKPAAVAAAAALAKDIVELVRFYPRWRLESLVLQEFNRGLLSLRGQLSDQLREINYCRVRLAELKNSFDDAASVQAKSAADQERPEADALDATAGAFERCLFPAGCQTLAEAITQFTDNIPPAAILELDERIQAVIQEHFTALVHVCLVANNILKKLSAAMQHEAERFISHRMNTTSAAELFLEQYADEEQARDEIAHAFGQAIPGLLPPPGLWSAGGGKQGTGRDRAIGSASPASEIHILALPAGAAGNKIRELATQALPTLEITRAGSDDDVVVYREIPWLPVADLEVLGPLGLEAYRQMTSAQHLSPHSRYDIVQWRPITK